VASLVQVLAALLVLAAFALAQARLVTPRSRSYLILNAIGASVLAVGALLESQWGFLLLEGAWAAISAWSLARALLRDAALNPGVGV